MSLKNVQSVEELAQQFKDNLEKTLKEQNKTSILVPIIEFERHFKFRIDPNHWNWLPLRYKQALWKVNVYTFKSRGREHVKVWIGDEHSSDN